MTVSSAEATPSTPRRTIGRRDDVPPPGPRDDRAFRRAHHTERGDLEAEQESLRPLFTRLIERLGNPENSLGHMLAVEAAPQEYLVDKIMPVREGGLIVGEGGGGKGLLQLLVALCLAVGINFGRFTVERPRRVLLLNFEDNQEQLHRRLRSTARVLFHLDAIDLGEGAEWRELAERNLTVVSLRGEGARLDHDELHDAIAQQAEVMGGIDWLGLDPLGRIAPEGIKFNSQEGAGEIHRQIDRLVERLGATVTVAHHVSKRGRSDKPGEDLEGAAASGSQMLVDLARFEWRLVPMSGSDARTEYGVDHTQSYAALTIPKNNYGPRVTREEQLLFRRLLGGALDYVPTASTAAARDAANDRQMLEALIEAGERRTDEWDAASGLTVREARASRKRLEEAGLASAREAAREEGKAGKPGLVWFAVN